MPFTILALGIVTYVEIHIFLFEAKMFPVYVFLTWGGAAVSSVYQSQ